MIWPFGLWATCRVKNAILSITPLWKDSKYGNAELRNIYPVIGGTADNIRKLKMQRLNVGFSRAKRHNGLCAQHAGK